MYYSDEIIEEVRSANDIVDVISPYVKLAKKGASYFGLCPFHNEKSGSFSVSQSKQMYYCFGCGAGGNVFTFLMEYEKMSFVESISYLANRAGITLPEVELTEEEKRRKNLKNQLYEINKETAKFFHYQLNTKPGKIGKKYFEKRGLSEETQTRFGLGYSNIDGTVLYRYLKNKGYDDNVLKESGLIIMNERGAYDRFRDRVMFPIMDINSKVIGFGGRIIGDGEPKYLNSPETILFDKGRNLYGLNFAKSSRQPNIIICEGYMDVIALHQAGFTQAVAALGTAFTAAHAMLLKRYTNNILMTFDSDGAGVKAALRAIPIMKSAGLSVKAIDMRPYKDPDEFIKALGPEEFQKRIDSAVNSFMYKIDKLSLEYDLNDPAEKTKFINEAAKELTEFEEEIERNNYVEAVAQKFGIDCESLKRLVNRYGNAMEIVQTGESQKRIQDSSQVKEDGVVKSQQILLTLLCNEPQLFGIISKYISPEDFVDDIYNKVAVTVYEQLKDTGNIVPGQIMNMFENEEEHKKVASLFSNDIREGTSVKEKEKILNETILNVKKNSLAFRNKNYSALTGEEKQKFIADKMNLQKIHVTLN